MTFMDQPNKVGDAFWADPNDIAHKYPYDPEKDFFIGRNPFNYDQAIGYDDDRHVFLCAGTRGGKGRSLVINNLIQWRGSIVSIDPKGENASIVVARRAAGDKYCKGLGQKTYVLDPYGLSKGTEDYKASCNLLDMIDADSPSLLSDCEILAEGMRVTQSGGESESWSRDGAQITALVMAHVKTSPSFEGRRNLITVRELLTEGLEDFVNLLREENKAEIALAKKEDRNPQLHDVGDAYLWLFEDMISNKAQRGAVARRAKRKRNLMMTNKKQWGSLIENAGTETNFLDDLQMVTQLEDSSHSESVVDLADLKNDPNGISIFICLPDNPDHPAIRWQKALVTLIFETMRKDQTLPVCGHKVLMVLDEFASMGKTPKIAEGMGSIGGAGVKMFIIVTQLSKLEDLYGKGWEVFLSGSGLQLFFGINDVYTGEYIQKLCGDTQVELVTYTEGNTKGTGGSRGQTKTQSQSHAFGQTDGQSSTSGKSGSTSESVGHNMSLTQSDALNWSEVIGHSQSDASSQSKTWQINSNRSYGTSQSVNTGENVAETYDPRPFRFFGPKIHSTNIGRSNSRGHSTSRQNSSGSSKGGSESNSRTISMNESASKGGTSGTSKTSGQTTQSSQTEGWNKSQTLSNSYTRTRTEQQSWAQTFSLNWNVSHTKSHSTSIQKRPLITISEMNRYLERVKQRDHPAYPGFMLVRIAGEEPVMLRKCYYDQDPLFEGIFTPHYAYKDQFLPFSKQRLLGCQYTDEHFVPLRIPEDMLSVDDGIKIELLLKGGDEFEKGTPLFQVARQTWKNKNISEKAAKIVLKCHMGMAHIRKEFPKDYNDKIKAPDLDTYIGESVRSVTLVSANEAGTVIDYAQNQAFQEDGDIMLLRYERPIPDHERDLIERSFFDQPFRYYRQSRVLDETFKDWANSYNRYQDKEKTRKNYEQLKEALVKDRRSHKNPLHFLGLFFGCIIFWELAALVVGSIAWGLIFRFNYPYGEFISVPLFMAAIKGWGDFTKERDNQKEIIASMETQIKEAEEKLATF